MKELETQFKYAGHSLHQIWRKGDMAVYERARPSKPPHELELVIIRVEKERAMPNGTFVAEHEAYPSASEWGTFGWSIPIKHKMAVLELASDGLAISKHRAAFIKSAIRQIEPSGIHG